MVHVVTPHLFSYLGQRVLFGHHSDAYILHVHNYSIQPQIVASTCNMDLAVFIWVNAIVQIGIYIATP